MATEEQNHEFHDAKAETSLTTPQQCSSLRKGGFVVLKGHPCKIVDMSTSKTGKHGHAKVHLVGVDIFTDKKYEELCPSTHNMDVPTIKPETYELVYLDDEGFLHMLAGAETRQDIRLPEGSLGERIRKCFTEQGDPINDGITVVVTKSMGQEHVTDFKPNA